MVSFVRAVRGISSINFLLIFVLSTKQVSCDDSSIIFKSSSNHSLRKAHQFDILDGDEDSSSETLLEQAQPAFVTAAAVIPEIFMALRDINAAINEGLNGTDTPNITSFLLKQGMEAFNYIHANSAMQHISYGGVPYPHRFPLPIVPTGSGPALIRRPGQFSIQNVPTRDRIPIRMPWPSVSSTSRPTTNFRSPTENYITLDTQQISHTSPTSSSFRRPTTLHMTDSTLIPNIHKPLLTSNTLSLNPHQSKHPTAEALLPGSSLSSLYKKLLTQPGIFTEFQLDNTKGFSDELLKAVSQAASGSRGQLNQKIIIPTENIQTENIHSTSEIPKNKLFPSGPLSTTQKPAMEYYEEANKVNTNFMAGRPVYWMNMFYPNGLPSRHSSIITTTQEVTTLKRKRRRRRRSTSTTMAPDEEYYDEYEDEMSTTKLI